MADAPAFGGAVETPQMGGLPKVLGGSGELKTGQQAFVDRMNALRRGGENAQQAAAQEPVKDEGEAAAPETNTKNADPANTRYERARRAMLRVGWKDDEFRELDREEAIRRGLKAEREQNRQAAAVAEAKRAAERKVQSSPADAVEGASSNASTSAQTRLAELLTKHGIGDDPQAKADLEALLNPILAEQAQLRAQLDQAARANGPDVAVQAQRLSQIRTELSESIPELGDNDDWKDVGAAMDRIGDMPKYADAMTNLDTLRMLVRDAATLALDVGERAIDPPMTSHGAASWGGVDTTQRRAAAASQHAASEDPGKARFVAGMQAAMRKLASGAHN